MPDLALITSLPEIRSAVLGDLSGAFLDSVNEPDGESIAAVSGFSSSVLVDVGEHLGLGRLRRVTMASKTGARLIVIQNGSVISACVESAKSLVALENRLDTTLKGGG